MKLFLALGTIILLSSTIPGLCQSTIISGDSLKIITLLKDSTFEIKEFTNDSILLFTPLDTNVYEMPLFKGGDPQIEFRKHIANKMRYPESAAEKGKSGRVLVQFTVNTEGYVENPVILIGVHPLIDAEAIRVVMISPRWTPGKVNGKPVKLIYTFPFNFVLN